MFVQIGTQFSDNSGTEAYARGKIKGISLGGIEVSDHIFTLWRKFGEKLLRLKENNAQLSPSFFVLLLYGIKKRGTLQGRTGLF
jgi:hypothetical protein